LPEENRSMLRRVPLQAAVEEQVQRPPLALTMTAE
jgi:hypothetical protein